VLEIKLLPSISELPASDWNALAGDAYPFIQWQFLNALEESGAVNKQGAWQAQHVLVYEQDILIALMPMYLKKNSQGEYVFDHSWASAYARHGLNYYPKLVTAIPFTP